MKCTEYIEVNGTKYECMLEGGHINYHSWSGGLKKVLFSGRVCQPYGMATYDPEALGRGCSTECVQTITLIEYKDCVMDGDKNED